METTSMMRSFSLALLALATLGASCEEARQGDLVTECSGPAPGLTVGDSIPFEGHLTDRPLGITSETFAWSLISQPEGSTAVFTNPNDREAAFIADAIGDYTVQVITTSPEGTEVPACDVTYTVAGQCWDDTVSTDHEDNLCPPEINILRVDSTFAVDGATNEVRPHMSPAGDWIQPTLMLALSDAFGTPLCTAQITHASDDGLPIAPWVASATDDGPVLFGFTLPSTAVVTSTCADVDLDPRIWTDDVDAFLGSLSWGVGISVIREDLHADIEANVVGNGGQDLWDETWGPYIMGAGFRLAGLSDIAPAGFINDNYAFAFEVDDAFNAVWDDLDESGDFTEGEPRLQVPATTSGTTLSTGIYQMFDGYGFDARCLQNPVYCE